MRDLFTIGAVQFGVFPGGQFGSVLLNLRLVPSYPAVLRNLAEQIRDQIKTSITPIAKEGGLTHLLTTPGATPLGVAVALAVDLALVYPSPDQPGEIEGSYDYNVPTLLLTDVLTDGTAERKLIDNARRHGLHVEHVVAVIRYGDSTPAFDQPLTVWRTLDDLIAEYASPAEKRLYGLMDGA
jgi:orotate phosphoribosyltransferase